MNTQRIKGVIDERIKEEQARQAKAQPPPARTTPRRRPPGQDGSPARLSSRPRDASVASGGRNPDPAEFAIGGDDESTIDSRATTPLPQQETTNGGEDTTAENPQDEKQESKAESEGNVQKEEEVVQKPPVILQDLPPEVKAKLRKLDKLESKYGELLKAYRAAHARVQAIEPFEATLRENTPLTSIADPSALTEYLTQINTKSGMVLDELKRVSGERDDFKKKTESLQADNKKLEESMQELRTRAQAQPDDASEQPNLPSAESEPPPPVAKDDTSSVTSPKSIASRIPSISIFSPKTKPKIEEQPVPDTSEDLFSFDSEVPKLEAQLAERQEEVDTLTIQVDRLRNDLKVARESTEGMVETLESRTREVNVLRDAKEKFESVEHELKTRITALEAEQKTITKSQVDESELVGLKKELDQVKSDLSVAREKLQTLESEKQDVVTQLEASQSEVNTLTQSLENERRSIEAITEKVQQKDEINKDLEDSLAFAKKAERDHEKASTDLVASQKRVQVMQGLMENLTAQLEKAKAEIVVPKNQPENTPTVGSPKADPVEALAQEETTAAKKKKNKKKKGKTAANAPAEAETPDAPQTPDVLPSAAQPIPTSQENSDKVATLNAQIMDLETQLHEKEATIDRLSARIKDQEALQEEIETLRDDLLHQGQEHVDARDALKTAHIERQKLQSTVDQLELDLAAATKQVENSKAAIDSHKQIQLDLESKDKAHQEIITELDLAKTQNSKLQSELTIAEQLAASRFKDITDLKDLLTKAQPELRSLRAEVEELKSTKDDLKNKTGELSRLEAKHEDLKTELKNLGKRLSAQDGENKTLASKLETESKLRERAELEIQSRDSDLRAADAKHTTALSFHESTKTDLTKSRKDNQDLQSRLRDLSDTLSSHERQISSLKEEVSLKTALHKSTQTLVQSLRDQIHELSVQTREATSKAENIDEELAESQRMLSERTREGQTMRMLLTQAESGTEARLREMKERMDTAIEERDRLEDDHSVTSRRMARDLEEAKTRARDAQRQLKSLEAEKEDLETRGREWRKMREDLEYSSKAAEREAEDARAAMASLREALEQSEGMVREGEKQVEEVRRTLGDVSAEVERLGRVNKGLADEVKSLQVRNGRAKGGLEGVGGMPSPSLGRTSIDSLSTSTRSPKLGPRVPGTAISSSTTSLPRSETPTSGSGGGTGLSQGTVDYVYLKNVLLQFLSQKDKGHQRQLIPVLGMLLHFDEKDQQRWNAAIAAK